VRLFPLTSSEAIQFGDAWVPHVRRCTERYGVPAKVFIDRVLTGQTMVVMIGTSDRFHAAFGFEVDELVDGSKRGEVLWVGGRGWKSWFHVIEDIHGMAKRLGCSSMTISCRRGLEAPLRAHGYRPVKVTMMRTL